MKDGDGNEVKAGDWIRFGYGIPPVGVQAPIVDRNGVLTVLTPKHKPKEATLALLEKCVGSYWKIPEPDIVSMMHAGIGVIHVTDKGPEFVSLEDFYKQLDEDEDQKE
jgi:hypothetical protein